MKSKVANIESIPTVTSIKKNSMAQRLLPGNMASIAGYATKGSSIPEIAKSSILISSYYET